MPASMSRSLSPPIATALSQPDQDDVPAVRLLADTLARASALRASDIHVEPGEGDWRIRLRIDGVLHETAHPPPHLRDGFVTRVKVLARLDIAEIGGSDHVQRDGKDAHLRFVRISDEARLEQGWNR